MNRRLQATLLLRCAVAAVCIALPVAVVLLGLGSGWAIGAFVGSALLWFAGLETGLLPRAIGQVTAQRAETDGLSTPSIWYIDIDAERQAGLRDFHGNAAGDPPTR